MKNRLSNLSIRELEELSIHLDTVQKSFWSGEEKDFPRLLAIKKDMIFNEMLIRFKDISTPPFKIGYSDGSGYDTVEGYYTITDNNDEPVIHSSKGVGIRNRIIAEVIIKLLNDYFNKE